MHANRMIIMFMSEAKMNAFLINRQKQINIFIKAKYNGTKSEKNKRI